MSRRGRALLPGIRLSNDYTNLSAPTIAVKTTYVNIVVRAMNTAQRTGLSVPSYSLTILNAHRHALISKKMGVSFFAFAMSFENIEVLHCALLMARGW